MPLTQRGIDRDRGSIQAILIDYEGTLNDTRGSGRLYARDLAAHMALRYHDHRADWPAAVMAAMGVMRRMQDEGTVDDSQGYAEYRRNELRAWATTLLEHAGVPFGGLDWIDGFIADVQGSVAPKFAPMPGALECIAQLRSMGLRLYLTSGGSSEYTAACLSDAGIAGDFAAIIGPDQVATLKNGPAFYQRCLEIAGVEAVQACAVDDSPGPLNWALALGCYAVGVGAAAVGLPARPRFSIANSLDDLPGAVSILMQ
jgi:beta-phosphoglucomutase-like phosphatase (HAD superfamily)